MKNPPGVRGCRDIDVGILTLDECKRRCFSHSVRGEECVLVSFLNDPPELNGLCGLLIKVENQGATLNVCRIENDQFVSARCTGCDLKLKY